MMARSFRGFGARDPRKPTEKGRLRMVKPRGPALKFQYNPTSVKKTGGTAAYNEVQRERRKSVTQYAGETLTRLAFTLFMDGYPNQVVDDKIKTLEKMAEPLGPEKRGPILAFDYGPTGRDKEWVIESLDPIESSELRNRNLQRVRYEVNVVLLEYVEPGVALKRKGGGGHFSGSIEIPTITIPNRQVIAREGDTLESVAARELGDASRWTELAELNGMRDPDRLTTGRQLVLPDG